MSNPLNELSTEGLNPFVQAPDHPRAAMIGGALKLSDMMTDVLRRGIRINGLTILDTPECIAVTREWLESVKPTDQLSLICTVKEFMGYTPGERAAAQVVILILPASEEFLDNAASVDTGVPVPDCFPADSGAPFLLSDWWVVKENVVLRNVRSRTLPAGLVLNLPIQNIAKNLFSKYRLDDIDLVREVAKTSPQQLEDIRRVFVDVVRSAAEQMRRSLQNPFDPMRFGNSPWLPEFVDKPPSGNTQMFRRYRMSPELNLNYEYKRTSSGKLPVRTRKTVRKMKRRHYK